MKTTVVERIKTLLEYKQLTNREFCAKVGFNYSTFHNYLNGRRKAVDLGLISKIIETFDDISPEWLIAGEGDMVKAPALSATHANDDTEKPFLVTKSGNKYFETDGDHFIMRVPLVPYNAYARYLSDTGDYSAQYEPWSEVDFIVDRIAHGRYVAFEIKGDSMDDDTKNSISQGDLVLARELSRDLWTSKLRYRDYPYWIVVTQNGILCKQMVDHDVETGMITFHSLNPSPEYRDFQLHVNEIRQLYNIIKKTTSAM
ncbi:S24 family peptidase [Bacteroides sp. 224]|uniref:XRE family transcriptional regulator n=1 Tax=Bacteroides sp. 224 TaxID=2302936 RepID=UPI0013D238EA|nr:S24 family peptidase [Bacteroides sp. 224]NDV63688.1 XRE family transcriptional regulator [Bacteroides sp. 224]